MKLTGEARSAAQETIRLGHYSHSVPSGKSEYYGFEDALVVLSIPANYNISNWLLGRRNVVWELSRLWAPDNHRPNLLTEAIAHAVAQFHRDHLEVEALISYADPNVGHKGGVYRAASWAYLGQCEESRAYRSADGRVVSRRAFHSGSTALRKADILAKGFVQLSLPGKHRFARGLNRKARKIIANRACKFLVADLV